MMPAGAWVESISMSILEISMFLNFRVVKMENDQNIEKLGSWNCPRHVAVNRPEQGMSTMDSIKDREAS